MTDDPTMDWRGELEASTVSGTGLQPLSAPVQIPALTVLHHPDPRRVGEQALLSAIPAGRRVALSRLEPNFAPLRSSETRPLADSRLSRKPCWLAPGDSPGSIALSCEANIRLSCDGDPVDKRYDIATSRLADGCVLLLAERVVLLLHLADPLPPPAEPGMRLIGDSLAMARLRAALRRVSTMASPALLRGETGTGKELAARAIHDLGQRPGPYVTVNVAAIPPSLATAELFGAARGAFTGAEKGRAGYFAAAEGGTLLLDEIGEAPPEVQVLLLRALESHEIQPVGSDRARRVDVRIIAATDADLEAAVADGRFRAPLLHRLSSSAVRLPTLRERRQDIGLLLQHFLRLELEACGRSELLAAVGGDQRPWLSAAWVARLAAFDWPGNVRQLRNAARQLVAGHSDVAEVGPDPELEALLGADSEPVNITALETGHGAAPPSNLGQSSTGRWHRRPSQIEEATLRASLKAHHWRLQPAARELGISRTSLYTLMDRFAIRRAGDLDAATIEAARLEHDGEVEAMARHLEVSKQALRQRLRELSNS